MFDWHAHFIRDALGYIALTTACLMGLVLYSPRLLLQDYPPAIQLVVAPRTTGEKRLSLVLGLPLICVLIGFPVYATFTAFRETDPQFLWVWTYASGIAFAFNLWDWLVIDWIVFCAITPRWLVVPGTEGHPAYQDYFFHFRGFLIGSVFSVVLGAAAAGTVLTMKGSLGRALLSILSR